MNREEKLKQIKIGGIFIQLVIVAVAFITDRPDISENYVLIIFTAFIITFVTVIYCIFVDNFKADKYWKSKLSWILALTIEGIGIIAIVYSHNYAINSIVSISKASFIILIISYVILFITERIYNFIKKTYFQKELSCEDFITLITASFYGREVLPASVQRHMRYHEENCDKHKYDTGWYDEAKNTSMTEEIRQAARKLVKKYKTIF